MGIFKFIMYLINFFFGAFVAFKIYSWFSPHVGFDLPVLTYLNVIAVAFIVSVFTLSISRDIALAFVVEATVTDEESIKKDFAGLIKTTVLSVILGMAYLWYLILY